MDENFDSTDRKPVEYFLLAISVIGLLSALTGIIVASPGLAVFGGVVLVLATFSFGLRASPED